MSENHEHGDLIDLHVSSPVLPRAEISQGFPEYSDNLIDTELPVLEKKLQTACYQAPAVDSRTSVDIEEILITIDDDDVVDAPIGKINSDHFFDLCDNNIEALDVLKNLDDVLNASLLESDNILNENEDSKAQQDIEDCLQDLDNYLKGQDSTCSVSSCEDCSTSVTSDSTNEVSGSSTYIDDSADEESLRKKLRQIEENYARFLASSGCINRGYIDTENVEERRPMSACDWECCIEKKRRKREERAVTVAVVRRERPALREAILASRRTRCATTADDKPDIRTSGSQTSVESDSEDIDWSWVQEVVAPEPSTAAADLELERSAHAASDRCTGTVVVEANRGRCEAVSRPEDAMRHEEAKPETATGSGTWLRDSMRRLRHLRLPIAEAAHVQSGGTAVAEPVAGPLSDDAHIIAAPVATEVAVTRPVSAPSRLLPRSTSRSSRSRSREPQRSEVSLEPGGRARSSSASSRSRRARSLSSSESSIPSSVDSTPSRTTAVSPTQENQNQASSTANQRRSVLQNKDNL